MNEDLIWNYIAKEFRKLYSLSPEEAERELKAAPDISLSENEIEDIVQGVISSNPDRPGIESTSDSLSIDMEEIVYAELEQETLQLCRNEGETDEDMQKIVDANEKLVKELKEE